MHYSSFYILPHQAGQMLCTAETGSQLLTATALSDLRSYFGQNTRASDSIYLTVNKLYKWRPVIT
jgi:hypothetical protein